ncbi:MAG: nucleotide exchange factor GrpE [Spirochaetales bacterium]|nr:nucleotide exchange factor GrpE [Spirochaetales bacterium]
MKENDLEEMKDDILEDVENSEVEAKDDETKSQIEDLNSLLKEKDEEIKELNDKYLRKAAEFDNFRKRMQKDKADSIKYANQKILLDIINVIDNLERAIDSGKESKDFDSFFQGVDMIKGQFLSMLEKNHNLKCFESLNQDFDPEIHEAIAMEPTDDENQIVLEEFQKGYFFEERVLRHAKVKVSQPNA